MMDHDDDEPDLQHQFWRYLRGIASEADGVNIDPIFASFCRAVEHYAHPEDVEEFQADLLEKHRLFLYNKFEFYEVPPELVGPLEAAIREA